MKFVRKITQRLKPSKIWITTKWKVSWRRLGNWFYSCQKLMGILTSKFGWILLQDESLRGSATTFHALLNKNSLAQTHICKQSALTHSLPWQRLSELQALQSQVSDADGFSIFSVLRNPDTQGHIIPQYEGINLFLHATNEKGCNCVQPTFTCY